jgi:hypothetical protein
MQSSPRGMFPASSQAIHYGLGSDRPVNSSLPVSGALSPRPLPPHPPSLLYAPAHPQVSPSPATGGEHIGPFQCVRPYKKKKGNRTMQTAPAATGEVAGSRPSWQHAMLLPPPPLRPEEEKAPLVATREQQHCQTDALEQESMSSNVKQERRVGIRKMRKRECNPLKVLCAEGGHTPIRWIRWPRGTCRRCPWWSRPAGRRGRADDGACTAEGSTPLSFIFFLAVYIMLTFPSSDACHERIPNWIER